MGIMTFGLTLIGIISRFRRMGHRLPRIIILICDTAARPIILIIHIRVKKLLFM